MLHPQVRDSLLDQELDIANRQRTGSSHASRDGPMIFLPVRNGQGHLAYLRLDGNGFDGQPFGVDVVDEDRQPLPMEQWPSGLAHSIHPIHHRPWVCVRGTAEYFTYPGHHMERWDTYRTRIRLPQLLAHLLARAGQ